MMTTDTRLRMLQGLAFNAMQAQTERLLQRDGLAWHTKSRSERELASREAWDEILPITQLCADAIRGGDDANAIELARRITRYLKDIPDDHDAFADTPQLREIFSQLQETSS